MIQVSTENIPGKKITKQLGLVRGNTVRAKNVGQDIIAGFKGLLGGEISEYTNLLTEARNEAVSRMVAEAEELGADAVVNIRFVTSMVAPNMAELLVFGTAVKVE